MKKTKYTKENGQVLVILAFIMIGLMAMLALGLDVGNVLTKRRAAQNAADAGALAGADVWCAYQDRNLAEATALDYATTKNEADTAQVFLPASDQTGLITVTTHIPVDTYFAGVAFDAFDVITATATASAGCFSACYAESVLPVAWNCRPTVDGLPTPAPDEEYKCKQEVIDLATLKNYYDAGFVYNPELYIVMDSYTYGACDLEDPDCLASNPPPDLYCIEDYPDYGTLNCDIDGDLKTDWLGSRGRSWIDLDGNPVNGVNPDDCSDVPGGDPPNLSDSGDAELTHWIKEGFGCTLERNTWVPEVGGVGPLFGNTQWRLDNWTPWATIPVFDDICVGHPYSPQTGTCIGKTGNVRLDSAGKPMYFHIVDYSYFYISCVTTNVQDKCPGLEHAKQANLDDKGKSLIGNDVQAIEGYFVSAFDPDLGGRCDGIGTGAYQIYLAK